MGPVGMSGTSEPTVTGAADITPGAGGMPVGPHMNTAMQHNNVLLSTNRHTKVLSLRPSCD